MGRPSQPRCADFRALLILEYVTDRRASVSNLTAMRWRVLLRKSRYREAAGLEGRNAA